MKKDLLIYPKTFIKTAMKKLGSTGNKVLLVVDKKNKLLGCLSDGDIRRYILSGGEINGNISSAFNSNPVFIYENDYSLEKLKKLLISKKVDLIPIINSNHVIINALSWADAFTKDEIHNDKKICVPLVIMAGGLGSRLEPLTNVLPKALIPIDGKPIINHIIEKFYPYGINEIYITVNHMANIMKAYFQDGYDGYKIKLVNEEVALGTVGGVKLIKDDLKDDFFLSTCDIIVDINLSNFFEFHKTNNYVLTLVASVKDYNIPYGVCTLKSKGSLKKIIEKPEYNFLINTGLYILNSSIIKYVPDGKLFHVTDLIGELLKRDIDVGVYPVPDSSWVDIGQWAEYKKTINQIYQTND